jgi:hypothetical protein
MDLNFEKKKGAKDGQLQRPQHMRGLSMDPAHDSFFNVGPTPGKPFSDSDSILEDPYRAVPGVRSRSASRSNSPAPRRVATGDSYSTMQTYRHDPEAKLLPNAQAVPSSTGLRNEPITRHALMDEVRFDEKALPEPEPARFKDGLVPPKGDTTRDSYFEKNAHAMRRSNNYLQALFQNSEMSSWDEKDETPSQPSSHPESTASTVIDSSSTQGTKTPLTSISDADSLPPIPSSKMMDWQSPVISPTNETNTFSLDVNTSLQPEVVSPEPAPSVTGRKPLRLGMPATEEPIEVMAQHSVERKVTTPYEQDKHKSFDASLHNFHMSVQSAATSNLTDILNTPRESSAGAPPVPEMPNSRKQSTLHSIPNEDQYEVFHHRGRSIEPRMSLEPAHNTVPPRGESLTTGLPIEDEFAHTRFEQDEFDFDLPRDQSFASPMIQDEEFDHIPSREQSQVTIPEHQVNNENSMIPARGESLAAAMPNDEENDAEMFSQEDYEFFDDRRFSVPMRPLPPDDPNENPEERANRIRSFYKEYFDDSQPYTSHVPLPAQSGNYYEDYSTEYRGEPSLYDMGHEGFVVAAPFAQPVTRRAMTPPPRAPPRFNGNVEPRGRSRAGSALAPFPPRNQSSMGSYTPRNQSAMGNYGPRGRSAMSNHQSRVPSAMSNRSRRPMPPPQPLNSLPTPSKLRDDSAIFSAADFAPPVSFRERQNGRRPESPLGASRPYSPSVRAFVPLNSSFDDLSSMPSP